MRKLLDLTIQLDLTLYDDGHVEWETNEAPITASGEIWPGAQGGIQKHLLEMLLRKYDAGRQALADAEGEEN